MTVASQRRRRKPAPPVHTHCWHDLGAENPIGTVNICCQCAPDWITIVAHVSSISPTLDTYTQQHPIFKFIVPELPQEDVQAIEPQEEPYLKVIPQ